MLLTGVTEYLEDVQDSLAQSYKSMNTIRCVLEVFFFILNKNDVHKRDILVNVPVSCESWYE